MVDYPGRAQYVVLGAGFVVEVTSRSLSGAVIAALVETDEDLFGQRPGQTDPATVGPAVAGTNTPALAPAGHDRDNARLARTAQLDGGVADEAHGPQQLAVTGVELLFVDHP